MKANKRIRDLGRRVKELLYYPKSTAKPAAQFKEQLVRELKSQDIPASTVIPPRQRSTAEEEFLRTLGEK